MAGVSTLGRIEGDLSRGGWQATGEVFNDADRLDFYQLIEANFRLYAGGAWEGTQRAGFAGHLLPEPWTKTAQGSNAPFDAFTAQEMLKRGRIQGIFFKHVASSPANDHQIVSMTYADIVEHILGITAEYGHCNFVDGVWPEGICQLDINSTDSSAIDEYTVKEGNFWQRLEEIAQIDDYFLWVGKDNTIHYQPHLMFAAVLPDPVFTLTSDWLLEPLRIERRDEEIGQLKLQGSTPTGAQITGVYPTDRSYGPVVVEGGYLASSDAKMDAIAERKYRFANRDATVEARLAGGVGLIIDLLDRIAITYSSAADGVSWSSKYFWVHKIVVEILEGFQAQTTLTLEAEN